jgi:hypothetical protein
MAQPMQEIEAEAYSLMHTEPPEEEVHRSETRFVIAAIFISRSCLAAL